MSIQILTYTCRKHIRLSVGRQNCVQFYLHHIIRSSSGGLRKAGWLSHPSVPRALPYCPIQRRPSMFLHFYNIRHLPDANRLKLQANILPRPSQPPNFALPGSLPEEMLIRNFVLKHQVPISMDSQLSLLILLPNFYQITNKEAEKGEDEESAINSGLFSSDFYYSDAKEWWRMMDRESLSNHRQFDNLGL